MEIRKIVALRGPNIWSYSQALEATVDLGGLKDSPSDSLPGFNERIMRWLPTMIEHRCSIGERGGFFERLRRGTYMGHILEHVTLELQSLAGTPAGFGRARETSEEGVYKVVVRYQEEEVGRACMLAARELILAAVEGREFDVAGEVRRLRRLASQVCLGPSTRAICEAAAARGIPWRRLHTNSLIQLGYGSRMRRIQAAETDRTSAIAEGIAQDKDLTRKLLAAAGVPVPQGRPVDDADDAWAAALEVGVPVVVKPQDGNQGRGVATNLTTREQVFRAYAAAREESDSVIVEQYAPGSDYRLLIVGGRLVAAARREPAHVVGDGEHSVAQLVEIVNRDPRRGEYHATSLSRIEIDTVALGVLQDQGYTTESVPPAGQTVLIRRNGNLSTGGTAIDVTERVHPEVVARAVDAARMVGLDIAGIDVIAREITRPLEEQAGALVEVNAAPGLRMHLEPSAGVPRPVGEAIVDMVFPPGANGRIPIVAVTGVNGKTTVTRFVAHILRGTGVRVGMTCTDGVYLDQRRIDSGDCSGPQSARRVLMNPAVDAAVFETARGGILREGLGFDWCDVGIVTNIGEGDHLGLGDVGTLEKLAQVKRCVPEAVGAWGTAVLNAADPLVAAMREKCRGKVLFFACDPRHPVLAEHRRAGGRAATIRDGAIVLAEGEREERLIALERVPLTHGGKIGFQVENALAAVSAAWSLGIDLETIRRQTESFAPTMDVVPGRFNIFTVGGATVIVDYGHNASAMLGLIDSLAHFPHQHRTVVHSMAGDRRDEDLVRQGVLLGGAFDRVVLYEDHYRRGRPEGQIIALLRQGLGQASRASEIHEVQGALAAVELGLSYARPGELILLQADEIDETVAFMRKYLAQHGAAPADAASTPSALSAPRVVTADAELKQSA